MINVDLNDKFRRIADMFLSNDDQYEKAAIEWLLDLLGEKDGLSNILLLSMYLPFDPKQEQGRLIDEDNLWALPQKEIEVADHSHFQGMVHCKFMGEEIAGFPFIFCSKVYSMQKIRRDFFKHMTKKLSERGCKIYPELFHHANSIVRQ